MSGRSYRKLGSNQYYWGSLSVLLKDSTEGLRCGDVSSCGQRIRDVKMPLRKHANAIYRSGEAVLTRTHNLCLGAKIGIPLQTPVFLYKCGGSRGYTFHGHVCLMSESYMISNCSLMWR